jgi:predicted amidohydrolase
VSTSLESVRVAAAPYAVGRNAGWEDHADRLRAAAAEAAARGARLLVFPEYAPLDLAADFPPEIQADLGATCAALQAHAPALRALHTELASRLGLWIVAGSFPHPVDGGGFLNRALVYAPDGTEGHQDKLILTRFERASGVFRPGRGLKVFAAAFGRFSVNVCYDSEFPLLARAQAEAGAVLLVVPSCTDTPQGASRVRIGCRARALENQIAVLQCPLLGEAAWSPCIDVNVGSAALFGPPDVGLPAHGVLAESTWNDSALFVAEVPLRRISALRRHGHVANPADWPEQLGQPVNVHGV